MCVCPDMHMGCEQVREQGASMQALVMRQSICHLTFRGGIYTRDATRCLSGSDAGSPLVRGSPAGFHHIHPPVHCSSDAPARSLPTSRASEHMKVLILAVAVHMRLVAVPLAAVLAVYVHYAILRLCQLCEWQLYLWQLYTQWLVSSPMSNLACKIPQPLNC